MNKSYDVSKVFKPYEGQGYIVPWRPRQRPKETKAERKERTRMRLFRQGIVLRRYQHVGP